MAAKKRNIAWRKNTADPYVALAAGVLEDAWHELEVRLKAAHHTKKNKRDHHLRRAVIAYRFLTADTCYHALLNLDPKRVESRIAKMIGGKEHDLIYLMADDEALVESITIEINKETENQRRLSRRAAAKRK